MRQFWELLQENIGPDFIDDPQIHADVRQLSLFFTEERDELPPDYINDPRLLRAYLAYYTPLNFEKIRTVLDAHLGTWPSKAPEEMRWIDMGCGPATATLAAMASLAHRYRKENTFPKLHIDLVDNQSEALATAAELVRSFAAKLKLDVTVHPHATLAMALNASKHAVYDLSLAANVLNELPPEGTGLRELLLQVWDVTRGVMFLLEPGHRVSSQRLVRFRERLLGEEIEGLPRAHILGPCTHNEKCPVNRTKHWCHFSEPVTDGRLTDLNLRVFKNARNWLKFSYLLAKREDQVAAPKTDAAQRPGKVYRAIGDLHMSGPHHHAIDLCQPATKHVLRMPRRIPQEHLAGLIRGAIVRLDEKGFLLNARPMTPRPLGDPKPRGQRGKPGADDFEPKTSASGPVKPRSKGLPKPHSKTLVAPRSKSLLKPHSKTLPAPRSKSAPKSLPTPRPSSRPSARAALPKPLAKPHRKSR